MIYCVLSEIDFIDEFVRMGRKDQFSRNAMEVLYDYYSEDGVDFEMDVIGICCDWTEASIECIREDFDLNEEDYPDDDSVLEYLAEEEGCYAVKTTDGILYQNF